MSKIKNPVEKKKYSYDRDHYIKGGESDKAFRKCWPRKKANANRKFRRCANETMRNTSKEDLSAAVFQSVPRKSFLKWGVISLREKVYWRLLHKHNTKGSDTNVMLNENSVLPKLPL